MAHKKQTDDAQIIYLDERRHKTSPTGEAGAAPVKATRKPKGTSATSKRKGQMSPIVAFPSQKSEMMEPTRSSGHSISLLILPTSRARQRALDHVFDQLRLLDAKKSRALSA